MHVANLVLTWLNVPDMTTIVADSVTASSPFIAVNMNYRLNLFSFGDGQGDVNLGFKDQRLAIDWVVKHIAGFGGDPVRPFEAST
jgi:carboxylesterase type B